MVNDLERNIGQITQDERGIVEKISTGGSLG